MKNRFLVRASSVAAAGAMIVTLAGVSYASFASAAVGGPTVMLSSTASSTTNLSSVPITATFSEGMSGFSSSSIDATNATIGSFSGSGANYTFDLIPSSQGAFSVMIPADAASSTASSTGNQASNTLNFTYDTTAPVISGVTVTPTQTGATIDWTTNENAFGQVFYGMNTSYGSSTTLEASAGMSHSAVLTNLAAGTTYHYQVRSTDQAGNMATTSDATFMTTAAATSTEPVISNINVSNVGTSTATINWTTDLSTGGGIVNYGTSASYGSSMTESATSSTSHSVTLTNLSEATLYHFDVQSGSTTSADNEFDTESTASTTPLAVNGVTTVQGNATADGTFADGWQWIMHLTVPSVEDAFRMAFSDFTSTNSSSTIPANGDIMIYSPESSNASTSASAITMTGSDDYGNWMYLDGDTATTTAGRQIDVYIDVAVPFGTAAGTYSTNFAAQSTPSNATSTIH